MIKNNKILITDILNVLKESKLLIAKKQALKVLHSITSDNNYSNILIVHTDNALYITSDKKTNHKESE